MSLEELRRRKMEELEEQLRMQQKEALQEQLMIQQQVEILERMAKQYMTNEAIARYGNLKAAHPEKALQVIALIAQLVQAGQIKEKVTDSKLREFLILLQKPKKDFSIKKI